MEDRSVQYPFPPNEIHRPRFWLPCWIDAIHAKRDQVKPQAIPEVSPLTSPMRSHRGPGLGSLPKKFPIAALDNSNLRYFPVSSIIRPSPYAAARICRNWIRTGPTGVSTGTTFNMSSIGIEMFTVNVDGWFDGGTPVTRAVPTSVLATLIAPTG